MCVYVCVCTCMCLYVYACVRVCVCTCVYVYVCVYVCVYLCVWTWMCMSVLESFQNARREASSGLLSFRARTPIEDAYRGRPLVSRVLFPPFALGWDPDRSRRDLSSRTDVGEEARRREGDRGPSKSLRNPLPRILCNPKVVQCLRWRTHGRGRVCNNPMVTCRCMVSEERPHRA